MAVKIFFCYAREDEPHLKELQKHLKPLQRQGLIDTWYDRNISPGAEWTQEINKNLHTAQIILLLVSSDFMDSDYCDGTEMRHALERHKRGEATVIPVILRPIYWQDVLGNLQALPTDAIPVTDPTWHNTDRAYNNIAEGIRKTVKDWSERIQVVAQAEQAARTQAKLDEFEKQIALVEARGYINLPELEQLIKEFTEVLSEKEIRNRIKVPVDPPQPQAQVNNNPTPMGSTVIPDHPNFFELLELNPADPWDKRKFEQTLEAKQHKWSRDANMIGSRAIEARRYLKLYNENTIQSIMLNAELRQKQAEEYRERRKAQHAEKRAQFSLMLEIVSQVGFIEQSQVDKWIADFKDVLTEQEIRASIRVPVKAPELDPTTFKQINDSLRVFFPPKKDLYDFLGKTEWDTTDALLTAARTLHDGLLRYAHKTNEITLKQKLAGYALVIFRTEEEHNKYRGSLRLSKLLSLLKSYEEALQGRTEKRLTSKQITLFLELVGKDGWSEQDALARLQEYARPRQWILELPVQERQTIFGIDLGATSSCIAYVNDAGEAEVIRNEEGDRTTPSVVLFEDPNTIVIGKVAQESAVLVPDRVVTMVKRHMGERNWAFECNGAEYRAEEIASYILLKLVRDAEEKLGQRVKDVVITCPVSFGIAEREATFNAGKIAGLNVLQIVNEPTAAAIAYGLQNEQDQVALLYDLGGGTFNATVIELKGGAITIITTEGNHYLGGRDWDEVIVQYLAQQWMEQTGSFEEPTNDEATLQDLWTRAEAAKRALSVRGKVTVPVVHDGRRVGVVLTRDTFDKLTAHLLERTISITRSTMDAARRGGYSKFDQILLVGGSTKMPQVQERLRQEFSIPLKVYSPDEAVAKGAAIYGQKLVLDKKTRRH